MRFFEKLGRGVWRPLIVGLVGFKHQTVNASHEGGKENKERDKCLDDIRHMVKSFQEWNKIPGLSLAISIDKNVIFNEGFGLQNVEEKTPATGNMKGDIASVSKLITAHCFIKFLLESSPSSGFQDLLGQRLRDLYPHLPTNAYYVENRYEGGRKRMLAIQANIAKAMIPLTWLFCHRAGFRATNRIAKEIYNSTEYPNEVEPLNLHNDDQMFAYYPGTRVLYTGMGCSIMGWIMDTYLARNSPRVNSFREYVSRELSELKMADTCFITEEAIKNNQFQNYAKGYTFHDDYGNKTDTMRASPSINYSSKYPSEGLISTVLDLVEFGNFYISMYKGEKENPTFSQELIEYMWSLHAIKRIEGSRGLGDFRIEGFGLQWDIESQIYCIDPSTDVNQPDKFDHRLKLRHGGFAIGYSSWLQIDFIVHGNNDPTQRKPNIESTLRPGNQVKNDKGCILDEEDILPRHYHNYNNTHDHYVDHTRLFRDTLSNDVTWNDTFPWEVYEGGHCHPPISLKSNTEDRDEEEEEEEFESRRDARRKRRKKMRAYFLHKLTKEKRAKIYDDIIQQDGGIFFLTDDYDDEDDFVAIVESEARCSNSEKEPPPSKPNPYISLGIIANLGQVDHMNILADRICELVRNACEKGAF